MIAKFKTLSAEFDCEIDIDKLLVQIASKVEEVDSRLRKSIVKQDLWIAKTIIIIGINHNISL